MGWQGVPAANQLMEVLHRAGFVWSAPTGCFFARPEANSQSPPLMRTPGDTIPSGEGLPS
jgi:hypothetical protein